MDKITFKVAYIAPGTTPKTLELLKYNKRGDATFIDNHGARIERGPLPGETVARLVLQSMETFDYNGEPMKRVFGVFEYLPLKDSSKAATEDESTQNRIYRQAHELLKTHQQVIVRDANGNDINPNRYGAITMFEMIEETKNIQNALDKNMRSTKAMNLCAEMFSDKESFIDFCYAFGISNIHTTPAEKLFNEVSLRIQINPDHFLKIYEDKDREVRALINKATSIPIEDPMNVGHKTVISQNNGLYYMDGEVIADSEDRLISLLKTNLRQREMVQRQLGLTPTPIPEVVNLPPADDELIYTPKTIDWNKQNAAARVAEMEKAIKFSYSKYEKSLKAKPEDKQKIEDALKADLDRKREGFTDMADAYDAFVNAQRKYYVK